jgi:alpha-1,3-rhamnosyl/mannosyltransferase
MTHPPTHLRIGFDVSSAAGHQQRGIAGYIRSLLPALAEIAPQIEPVLFLRDERWLRKSLLEDLIPGAEFRWMMEPVRAPLGDLDAFHGMGTRLPRSQAVPRSFTLHDMRGFDLGGGVESRSGRRGNRRKTETIRRAEGVICLTEYGKARLLKHFPQVAPDTVQVIGHGVDPGRFHPYDEEDRRPVLGRLGLDGPYFLQLGSFFPHKNLELSIRGFARSRASKDEFRLVFAGGGGSEAHCAGLHALVESLGLSERITWIDDLPSDALPVVLSGARGLLMPSRYEGFGLPILEAMASGVPGVCSTSTCLPEVTGGIWDACDPDDDEVFAEAIDRLAHDDSAHAQRATAGLARAQEFTWERCAASTASFLRRVAEEAPVS